MVVRLLWGEGMGGGGKSCFFKGNVTMKMLTNLLIAIVTCGFAASVIVQGGTQERGTQASTDPDWSERTSSMDKMHMAMGAIKPTGNSDVAFLS